jgi:hypothetical protein
VNEVGLRCTVSSIKKNLETVLLKSDLYDEWVVASPSSREKCRVFFEANST